MPITGCTIQTIYPYDNPNDGRVKINQNFECLSNNVLGPGSGITSNPGNRWYIPSGETVTIDSTYQGFIYGDLTVDGTLNLEDDSQIVILNGTLINTGGTINASSGATIYITDTPNTYITGGTYSSGTITFSANTGETFEVTGLSTGSTLFFNAFNDFPSGGTNNAIYVDDTNNIGYLWNSSANTYTNIAGTNNPFQPDEIPLTFAQAATTGALFFSPIYTNGLSGVGATLTATTVGVLRDTSGVGKIDSSYNPSVGDVILVKNQTATTQNGLYTIDDTGSLSTRYRLTRASDFDQSSELYPLQVNVLGGSDNNLKFFNQVTSNPTIGTSGLVFSISAQQSITNQIAFVDTATSAPLPSCTYISGTTNSAIPGIGAVLSATSVGALGYINGLSASTSTSSISGFTRVLVKDQVNPAHNGDYSVTNSGGPSTRWVLTRINSWAGAYSRYTRFFLVSNNGSTKAGKYYFTTPNSPVLTNATIGTAPINIVEYGGAGGATFTGGTVSGATIFTAGLTATTISATTYQGLPASTNIYNSDGVLTGPRIVNLSGNQLTFSSTTSGGSIVAVYGSGNTSQSRTYFEMGHRNNNAFSSSIFLTAFAPNYSGTSWGSFYSGSSALASYHESSGTTGGVGNMFFDLTYFGASTVANRYFAWHAAPLQTPRGLSTEMMRLHILGDGNGNLGINVKGVPRERLHVSGNTLMDGSLTATTATISGSGQNILTVIGSGNTSPLFSVQGAAGRVLSVIDNANSSSFSMIVSGNTSFQGSLTARTATISGAGQNILTVIGSGNTSPLFSVQGSYGELFSVTDSLSGSLFSVNDISGLPILEVFDDNTMLMGSFLAPSLNTTVKTLAGIGDTNIYSLNASAYTGAFFEYTASHSGGTRAGSIMSVWSGSSINYTETPTASIGETTGITFNMTIGTTATLRASGTTAGWTVKTIVRSI
jgi:hypothetical protein